MKKPLFITGALLALTASIASAQGGIDLSWTDCGAFGLAQKNYASCTNFVSDVLVVSAVSPAPMDSLIGVEVVADLQSNTAILAPWWDFNGCRSGALSGNADFTLSPGTGNCVDPWSGNASGSVVYSYQYGGANRARVHAIFTVPSPVTSNGNNEYYMMQFVITGAKTTSCTGCTDGVCIWLNSVTMMQPATMNRNFTMNYPLLRSYVVWQRGAGACPIGTPTRNGTWGSIKALYR